MSFQQGLSGLNTAAKQLDTIGNNVANASTVGFKGSQAQFADLYAASLSGGGGIQTGTGVKLVAVAQQFTQGNITNTSNAMDTAISGPGFFQLTNPNGAILYSRNGQFQVDKDGFIVSNQGHKVMGFLATAGVISAAQGPLQILTTDLSPNASTGVTVGANLDSREVVPIAAATFDPGNANSYNKSTSLSVYDSLGVSHMASLYFVRQPVVIAGTASIPLGSNTITLAGGSTAGLSIGNTVTLATVPTPTTYTITAVVDGTTLTVTPAAAAASGAVGITTNAGSPRWDVYLTADGTLVPVAAPAEKMATLAFNTSGAVLTATPNPNLVGGTAASTQGISGTIVTSYANYIPLNAAPLPLAFDFTTMSQYGSNFGVNTLAQDGYTSGRLNGFSAGSDGTILGRYSNGQTQTLGRLLLANFVNPQGLQPMGDNEWVETVASGGPLIGGPGTGNLGVVQSSAVEESNVDLTAELVNMITAQRVYQANAQTIKAQDALLQTITNLR